MTFSTFDCQYDGLSEIYFTLSSNILVDSDFLEIYVSILVYQYYFQGKFQIILIIFNF